MDDNADGVGARVFHCLLDDVSLMCSVRECTELEEHFGTSATDSKIDKEIMLRRCTKKAPSVANIERDVGCAKLWNAALDLGAKHTRGLQAISRVLRLCVMYMDLLTACLLDHLLNTDWSNNNE